MNGNGKIEALLERIADGQDKLREELTEHKEATTKAIGGIAAGQERLAAGQEQLRHDMNRGFSQVNARIDNVLAIVGSHHDDHEQRIQVLEERVLGKSG